MGSQIMMQAAYAGKAVVGFDISEEIPGTFKGGVDASVLPSRPRWIHGQKFDEAISRITTTTSVK